MLAVATARGGVGALAYRGQKTAEEKRKEDRFSFWAMLDVKRDVYAPIAFLLVGFGSVIGWTMYNIDAGAAAIIIVSIGLAFVTVVKTVVLTLGAIIIAPRFGLSFGDLRTAILKIAAIIVFTDGATIWLPFGGIFFIRGLFYGTLLNGMIMGVMCLYLFDMENDETAMFAVPMALVSKITGIVLTIVAVGVIMNMAGVNTGRGGGGMGRGSPTRATVTGKRVTPPGYAAPGAGNQGLMGDDEDEDDEGEGIIGNAADAPSPSPALPPLTPKERAANADRAIYAVIGDRFLAREAHQFRGRAQNAIPPVAEKFYAAGAPAVYIDLRVRGKKTLFGRVYVELPDEPAVRAACLAVAAKPADLDGMVINDDAFLQDVGQRFLVLGEGPPPTTKPAQPAAPPPPGKKTSDLPF
jgi:hypothetical protein